MIKSRNADTTREGAARMPRSEGDQAVVDGWPLYRTARGQAAFNDAMATLTATDGPAPAAEAFKGCHDLQCELSLPPARADGWIQPGRLWVSPTSYVLFAHSPRGRGQDRRRSVMNMRVFVFHEFHNSSRNTDMYDTISSHSGGVFVPFYMSKQATDAQGRQFVIVMQVAPLDVVSVHASNHGSAGPGIEIAKNAADPLDPVQGHAGVLIASIVKSAVPRLQVVNHRGREGLTSLELYERRLASLRDRSGVRAVALPFVPATPARVATANARLDDLILRRGASPRLAVAERSFLPPKTGAFTTILPVPTAAPRPLAALPQLLAPPRVITRAQLLRVQQKS